MVFLSFLLQDTPPPLAHVPSIFIHVTGFSLFFFYKPLNPVSTANMSMGN